ncbi:hypothetical protein SAHL_15930 [Salinisphaera orenii YIM 95161]|uniref:Uncharacterized protein n=1 Tax=Salinisphaera orenii YIM 95161 TaxID=1051139 RepID=A0A423PF11_9GAMM|nr:hypothetical protein SAHL_15930 [Salinisphaera halophila YIM 95161]
MMCLLTGRLVSTQLGLARFRSLELRIECRASNTVHIADYNYVRRLKVHIISNARKRVSYAPRLGWDEPLSGYWMFELDPIHWTVRSDF